MKKVAHLAVTYSPTAAHGGPRRIGPHARFYGFWFEFFIGSQVCQEASSAGGDRNRTGRVPEPGDRRRKPQRQCLGGASPDMSAREAGRCCKEPWSAPWRRLPWRKNGREISAGPRPRRRPPAATPAVASRVPCPLLGLSPIKPKRMAAAERPPHRREGDFGHGPASSKGVRSGAGSPSSCPCIEWFSAMASTPAKRLFSIPARLLLALRNKS